jgi:hypothetical protein
MEGGQTTVILCPDTFGGGLLGSSALPIRSLLAHLGNGGNALKGLTALFGDGGQAGLSIVGHLFGEGGSMASRSRATRSCSAAAVCSAKCAWRR